ncbi:MAG: septum formation initiator family protein [Acidobacteriia bacterium]|nr:septum formation initiator family protein [Terriglobia bacterium]
MEQWLANSKAWIVGAQRTLATMGVVLLACVVGYKVVFGSNGLVAYHQKRGEYQQLRQQIQSLERENGALDEQNKALKDDPRAIEKEARERLRYARKGEKIYTLTTAPASPVKARK